MPLDSLVDLHAFHKAARKKPNASLLESALSISRKADTKPTSIITIQSTSRARSCEMRFRSMDLARI